MVWAILQTVVLKWAASCPGIKSLPLSSTKSSVLANMELMAERMSAKGRPLQNDFMCDVLSLQAGGPHCLMILCRVTPKVFSSVSDKKSLGCT